MTDQERAEKFVEGVCQRLRDLAANRPFRFIDTRRRDAQSYLNKLVWFQGYSEDEIVQAEKRLNVVFPTVFHAYLARLGKARGQLFVGSDLAAGPLEFAKFSADAEELMRESQAESGLPLNAVVFLFHQGYSFCYLLLAGGCDGPVMTYSEGETLPKQAAASFEDFLQSELALMETVNKESLGQGGHFLSISADDTVAQHYPALSGGMRPIDQADAFLD